MKDTLLTSMQKTLPGGTKIGSLWKYIYIGMYLNEKLKVGALPEKVDKVNQPLVPIGAVTEIANIFEVTINPLVEDSGVFSGIVIEKDEGQVTTIAHNRYLAHRHPDPNAEINADAAETAAILAAASATPSLSEVGFSDDRKFANDARKYGEEWASSYRGSHDPKKVVDILLDASNHDKGGIRLGTEVSRDYGQPFLVVHGSFLKDLLAAMKLNDISHVTPSHGISKVRRRKYDMVNCTGAVPGGLVLGGVSEEQAKIAELLGDGFTNLDCLKVTFMSRQGVVALKKVSFFPSADWANGVELWSGRDGGRDGDRDEEYSVIFMRHCPACHNLSTGKEFYKKQGLSGYISNCLPITIDYLLETSPSPMQPIRKLYNNVFDGTPEQYTPICSASFRTILTATLVSWALSQCSHAISPPVSPVRPASPVTP